MFRKAFDYDSLKAVYEEIDALEQSKISTRNFTETSEWFWLPLAVAIGGPGAGHDPGGNLVEDGAMKAFVIQWPWVLWVLVLLVPLAAAAGAGPAEAAAARASSIGAGPARPRNAAGLAAPGGDGLLVLALARPGYAPERRAVSQSGRDVVFAIDVSRSMLARGCASVASGGGQAGGARCPGGVRIGTGRAGDLCGERDDPVPADLRLRFRPLHAGAGDAAGGGLRRDDPAVGGGEVGRQRVLG